MSIWGILKQAAYKAVDDRVPRLGAAVAFYTVLSLAPLLVIATAVAGWIFGNHAARGKVVEDLTGYVGKQGAEAIQTILASAAAPRSGLIATVASIAALLFAATGVFSELHDAMNSIWKVQLKPGNGVIAYLKDRLLGFALVLGVAALLLASLVVSTALSAINKFFVGSVAFPGAAQALNFGVSFVVITLLFAMMFRALPDVKIRWGDVWLGAAVTSLLFNIGKALIAVYLGRSSVGSAYGAAGSLVVLLVWIYYSAQIYFFGAELTQVYAEERGRHIAPVAGAEHIECKPVAEAEKTPAASQGRQQPVAPDSRIDAARLPPG